MAGQPNLRIGVEFCDVEVHVFGSLVVPILNPQRFGHASVVASIGGGLAITNLPAPPGSSLAAATSEKQIVVLFVLRGGSGAIEQGC